MKKYYIYACLFNFISGCILFFVVSLWIMSLIYIGDAFGWIGDPTLDEGLLIIFLGLSLVASLIYFPVLIFTNIELNKKVNLSKVQYSILAIVILISGLASFFWLVKLK